MLKFAAMQIGMSFAAAAMAWRCSGEKPVVPITIALRLARHSSSAASVASGCVKSMSTSNGAAVVSSAWPTATPTSAWPTTPPTSSPSSGLSWRSIAATRLMFGAASAAWITARPMRPAAPWMAMRVVFIGESLWGRR